MAWLEALETAAREGCGYVIASGSAFMFALVDEEDLTFLEQFTWHPLDGYLRGYRKGDCKKRVWMHRVIMDAPFGVDVDHHNRNRTDNRRSNLRLCNQMQNSANAKKALQKHATSSQYKGVCWHSGCGKWRAKGRASMKTISLGLFASEVEAARAYDTWAANYFGEFALLNGV